MRMLTTAAALLISAKVCLAQDTAAWTQLSRSTCNVDEYQKAHPDHDGRGVIIAVLDTGVDMGVPGLQKTSTGRTKVVDVQDFSGEGDIELKRARWNEPGDRIIRYDDEGRPEAYVPPGAEARPAGTTTWFGTIKEKTFANTSVPDLNDNGKQDELFAVCVISRDDGGDDDAVCYIDLDSDRDFSKERALKNYKLNHDSFVFPRTAKEKQTEPLTCAVNIFPKERRLSLHFDDGGHGTHVAGIACGFQIQGQTAFNGIAPGANVISLKIGNNALAGGATTTGAKQKAFEYAAQYARDHNVMVVCNLSYGIGSAREGYSSIDTFVDKLLRTNPHVVLCTSAGNEGPGLSSVGTPAAANAAISVAALLAADTARDVLGVQIPSAQVTGFSSRGGELDKPDIATPGMTTSTVPKWEKGGDFWSGTSMASPYAAGMSAVLAQIGAGENGKLPRSDWIKTALMAGAAPIEGFTTLDYGAGIPNMMKAAEIMCALAKTGADDPLFTFDVTTDSPYAVDGKGRAAFWRSPYFPSDRPQEFTLKPVFAPITDATAITAFSKRLILRSTADWLRLEQDQVYFRAEQSAVVRVKYDAGKLTAPGLYFGAVEGRDDGRVALRLWNAVVVPYRFNSANDYRLVLDDQLVDGWNARRYFAAVPAGATAMHVALKAPEGRASTACMRHIFRPDGNHVARMAVALDTRNDKRESKYTIREELEPGVWELVVTSLKADERSPFQLDVRFDGVHGVPCLIDGLDAEPGEMASGSVHFRNDFDRPTTVTVSGRIEGYRKEETKKLTAKEDTATFPIKFTRELRAARIRIELSPEDYAKLTDCAVNVYDPSGKAIAQDGLNEAGLTIEVDNPDPSADSVDCKLEIRPAFADRRGEDSAEFTVKIDALYENPVEIDVTRADSNQATLYPGIAAEFEYALTATAPKAPDKTSTIGYIHAVERAGKAEVARIEIEAK